MNLEMEFQRLQNGNTVSLGEDPANSSMNLEEEERKKYENVSFLLKTKVK